MPQDRHLPRPAAATSWDPLAAWYDGWVGQQGSYHHQKIAIPAVLELLELQRGETVLDIGCGQGALAEAVLPLGAEYTGVDASPRLIEMAKQRHPQAQFLVGDARRPARLPGLNQPFDATVFLLSIQDMDNLEAVLQQARQVVRTAGRLVILMTHPAFRIPRQSGWGTDEQRKLQYRRVDSYLSEMAVPLKPFPGQPGVSKSYHRPLQSYFQALKQSQWRVEDLREITAEALLTPQTPRGQRRAVQEIPLFLGLRAVAV